MLRAPSGALCFHNETNNLIQKPIEQKAPSSVMCAPSGLKTALTWHPQPRRDCTMKPLFFAAAAATALILAACDNAPADTAPTSTTAPTTTTAPVAPPAAPTPTPTRQRSPQHLRRACRKRLPPHQRQTKTQLARAIWRIQVKQKGPHHCGPFSFCWRTTRYTQSARGQ
jgi:hypothetical protein